MLRPNNNNDIKTPSAILTSDWHLREDQPVCRTDAFWETQWKKIDFISDIQRKYNCPVLHAGDLFNHWKPSPYLLSETIRHVPNQFYTVYGNHDLPQHNLELINKCGVYTLEQADKLNGISPPGFQFLHWGMNPFENEDTVLIWHIFTYQGKQPWPDCPSPTANKLLKKYPNYDLIVTGDNHQPFVEEYEGRLLVNPGSILRQSVSETHKPRVYLWFSETNSVEAVYLPLEDNVISREHIEIVEKRNERIDAFVNKLNGEYETSISFEENLKRFNQANRIRESVMNIVYKSIE